MTTKNRWYQLPYGWLLGAMLGWFWWCHSEATQSAQWLVLSPQALAHGRWWTVVTSIFCHTQPLHLLSNLFFFILASWILLVLHTSAKSGWWYFILSGVTGNLTLGVYYLCLHQQWTTLIEGCSGALYGWLCLAGYQWWQRRHMRPWFSAMLLVTWALIMLNILWEDWQQHWWPVLWLHGCGLITGLALVGLQIWQQRKKDLQCHLNNGLSKLEHH